MVLEIYKVNHILNIYSSQKQVHQKYKKGSLQEELMSLKHHDLTARMEIKEN